MPSLKDIRGRIGSVRNIAQITRAMEMVAASRMKRAQDAILAARPYSDELRDALSRVAAVVGEEVDPLLARRPVQRVALIMITTDRGLAGSLNANAIRAALRWTQSRLAIERRCAGGGRGDHDRPQGPRRPAPRRDPDRRALQPARRPALVHRRDADRAPRDRGLPRREVRRDPRRLQHLHLDPDPAAGDHAAAADHAARSRRRAPSDANDEYLFEPSAEEILSRLLPHFVAIDLYRAVLENQASEQSARMIAMRNSTDNANELIEDLTLVYNKTRQATITREMIEIASGAEALGG